MTATVTAEKSGASFSLSFDALLAKARELSPLVSDQGIPAEKQGRLTDTTVSTLRQSGLLSLCVPRALGGAELWPAPGIEIIETLTRADGSTGWVVMATQVAMATCAAYLPPTAAKTVFKNHIPIIAGQGAPVGRADTNGSLRIVGKLELRQRPPPLEWRSYGRHRPSQRRTTRSIRGHNTRMRASLSFRSIRLRCRITGTCSGCARRGASIIRCATSPLLRNILIRWASNGRKPAAIFIVSVSSGSRPWAIPDLLWDFAAHAG